MVDLHDASQSETPPAHAALLTGPFPRPGCQALQQGEAPWTFQVSVKTCQTNSRHSLSWNSHRQHTARSCKGSCCTKPWGLWKTGPCHSSCKVVSPATGGMSEYEMISRDGMNMFENNGIRSCLCALGTSTISALHFPHFRISNHLSASHHHASEARLTPSWSQAKSFPVRPRPVWTSSAIQSTLCFVHSSRTPGTAGLGGVLGEEGGGFSTK